MNEEANRNAIVKYRPDIDGLRAVAILSVMAFHLSPWRAPGGFVGVDVFFVISGYLISAIVFSEIATGRFSVLGFYERRVRRIFPALLVMLVVVSPVISCFLLPNEFVDYAKSVITATFSCSNFYFWRHSGYFDSPMSKPLLHTWSLAIEEQFYILFPIFLLVTRRLVAKGLKHSVVILLFSSLAASVATVNYNLTTAFYMPYTRAWELLIGTVISLGFFPRVRPVLVRNGMTLLGIAMIGYSVLRYSSRTPFPGLAALVPCVGSALIIGAGESGSTLVSKALSWRPMVFIGLISYSLYLWHWPVIILNDLGLSGNFAFVPHTWAFVLLLQKSNKAMVVLVSFVLAVLSWRFVERPFRSRPRRIERRPVFALTGAVMVVLFLCSVAVIHASGFQGRFPRRAVQIASFRPPPEPISGKLGDCVITDDNQATVFTNSQCLRGAPGKATYLLLGDSHAAALWDALKTSLPSSNVALAAAWGCSPSIHGRLGDARLCKQMMDFIFQNYLLAHAIQGLILEARWRSEDLNGVSEIVTWAKAKGISVIVFGPVVEYDSPLPRLLAYSIAWNNPNLAQQHRLPYSPVVDSQMRNLAENRWHVFYASIYQATCEGDRCLEYADENKGIPLMIDGDHLSEEGSRLLVRRLFRLGELDCLNDKLLTARQILYHQ
jgi:peptidoglycan/LPS O-acetylase OafA/YrhL